MMKKLKDNENESSSKMSDLTSQIDKLLADIGTLHAQKNELEEQIISKSDEASTQVKSITNELNACMISWSTYVHIQNLLLSTLPCL